MSTALVSYFSAVYQNVQKLDSALSSLISICKVLYKVKGMEDQWNDYN